MKFTVYQTKHIPTARIYIGVHRTIDIDDGYLGSGKHIRAAISKYGKEQFEKTILFVFDNEKDMLNKERELVTEEFCRRSDTFNIRAGADGYEHSGFEYINKNKLNNSANQHAKAAARHRYLMETDVDYRDRWYQSLKGRYSVSGMIGKTHTEETKEKMSISHRGKNNSQYGTRWITNETENKKIKREEPVPSGWRLGRITKSK